jgi:hypothetical protein
VKSIGASPLLSHVGKKEPGGRRMGRRSSGRLKAS